MSRSAQIVVPAGWQWFSMHKKCTPLAEREDDTDYKHPPVEYELMNRILVSLLILSAIALFVPQPAMAITIDTVPVGNVGNANDPATGGSSTAVSATPTASARPK